MQILVSHDIISKALKQYILKRKCKYKCAMILAIGCFKTSLGGYSFVI